MYMHYREIRGEKEKIEIICNLFIKILANFSYIDIHECMCTHTDTHNLQNWAHVVYFVL